MLHSRWSGLHENVLRFPSLAPHSRRNGPHENVSRFSSPMRRIPDGKRFRCVRPPIMHGRIMREKAADVRLNGRAFRRIGAPPCLCAAKRER